MKKLFKITGKIIAIPFCFVFLGIALVADWLMESDVKNSYYDL